MHFVAPASRCRPSRARATRVRRGGPPRHRGAMLAAATLAALASCRDDGKSQVSAAARSGREAVQVHAWGRPPAQAEGDGPSEAFRPRHVGAGRARAAGDEQPGGEADGGAGEFVPQRGDATTGQDGSADVNGPAQADGATEAERGDKADGPPLADEPNEAGKPNEAVEAAAADPLERVGGLDEPDDEVAEALADRTVRQVAADGWLEGPEGRFDDGQTARAARPGMPLGVDAELEPAPDAATQLGIPRRGGWRDGTEGDVDVDVDVDVDADVDLDADADADADAEAAEHAAVFTEDGEGDAAAEEALDPTALPELRQRVGPRYFDNVDHAGKPALLACVRAAAYFPALLARYDALGRCAFEETRQARLRHGPHVTAVCRAPAFVGCRAGHGVERFYYVYDLEVARTPRPGRAQAELDQTRANRGPPRPASAEVRRGDAALCTGGGR